MDPIWNFAKRNHDFSKGLLYDSSFWFLQVEGLPEIKPLEEGQTSFYANPELYDYYVTLKKNFVLPEGSLGEILIYDRAHPLGSIPRILPGNLDEKVIELVFGIQNPQIKVHVESFPFQMAVFEELSKPSNHFIMAVEGMFTNIECQHLFILSLNYERITLFQPAISNVRYLIAIGSKPQMTDVELVKYSNAGLGIRSKIDIPEAFERWLTSINNTYLGINAEILTHLIESQNAFNKQGMSYWPDASYDIKRVVNLLEEKSFLPNIIKPKDLQRFNEDEIKDERIRYSMHLWDAPELGEFEIVPGSEKELEPRKRAKLHMYVDFEKDKQRDWDPKIQNISGDNWGQRKLLIAEIQFLTEYSNPDKSAVVFYVGSAPFDHGPFLIKYFDKINFVLIDPRPMNSHVLQYQGDRVMIIQDFFDEKMAEEIVNALLTNTPATKFDYKKLRQIVHPSLVKNGDIDYFYVSDIRTDVSNVSADLHEAMIEKDMYLQSRGLNVLANLRRPKDIAPVGLAQEIDPIAGEFKNRFVASVKFRHSYDMTNPFFEYEEGVLATQTWAPLNSTELRLWTIPGSSIIKYDKLAIERIMAHHNVVTRQQRFDDPGIEGYDECHDCHMELEILDKFARVIRKAQNDDEVYEDLLLINNAIRETLGGVTLKEHAERRSKPKIHVLKGLNEKPLFDPFLEYHRSLAFASAKRYFTIKVMSLTKVSDKRIVNLAFKQFMFYLANVHRIEVDIAAESSPSDSQLINWKTVKIDPLAVSIEDALDQILKQNELNIPKDQISQILRDVNYSRELAMLKNLDSKGIHTDVEFNRGKNDNITFAYTAHGQLPDYARKKHGKGEERIPQVRSLKVKRNVLSRFFARKENPSDFDIDQLLHVKPFLDRVFCVLTRYKNIHFDGICNAPKELIERIKPDFISGTNIISSAGTDYGAIYADFELQFTPFNNPFTHEKFPVKFQKVLIYPPNIKPLIISYIRKWVDILKKTEILALIFVLPSEYKKYLEESGFQIAEHPFNGNIFDYCEMKQIQGEKRTIYVLKTERSGFVF